MPTVSAFIGLGANLGDPAVALRQAIAAIAQIPGCTLLQQSALYGSTPVDAGGDDYVNAVVEVATDLSPLGLLQALQAIENAAGRERPYRNAPRTLDLDVLLYGDCVSADPLLTLPHPRMLERAFVLQPLAEIAPNRVTSAQLAAVSHQAVWPRSATAG
jgi:2-amino-4-hydroxy-6-hydroxymethyldihydropteridine diphosphokinase